MALDMNPEIRAQWTAALRSGEYKQGSHALRVADEFCCLGVLCDLAQRAGVTEGSPDLEADEDGDPSWSYDGRNDLLPDSVCNWAGLASNGPDVVIEDWEGEGEPGHCELASLNDDEHWDFTKIADAIEGKAKAS